jgi:mono/diheme cytochrome c family protein
VKTLYQHAKGVCLDCCDQLIVINAACLLSEEHTSIDQSATEDGMKHRALTLACALGAAMTFAASAFAQDSALGRTEFSMRCAVCHGNGGMGDGEIGGLFSQQPKDLTLLSKENGGAFPFSEVYQAVDGRRDIAAHGMRTMPVWGDYFMADSMRDLPSSHGLDSEAIVQGRILSVVYFLQSIQQP